MITPKKIHKEHVARALEKAEHYRLLNEPGEAESICLDVLEIDSKNQQALVILLLALSDRFSKSYSVGDLEISGILERLTDDYSRAYYEGIIFERKAKVKLQESTPGSQLIAYQWLQKAMTLFERAEKLHPPGNEDAILRWNTCARIIIRNNLARFEELEHERQEQHLE